VAMSTYFRDPPKARRGEQRYPKDTPFASFRAI
jgi:hypothetical protein